MIYLDNAATTFLKPRAVYEAVSRAMRTLTSPGRGGYGTAERAAETAFLCRERAARLFHADGPEHVVFTFNATHALNMAIGSIVPEGGRVVVSGFEHNSVMRPLYALGAKATVASGALFDTEETLEAFRRAIAGGPDAVIVNHVSNVFGCIQPVEEIAEACRFYGVPLIVDASQSAGAFDLDFRALGAAYIAMPGHKGLYGPQGTGLLLCREPPKPLLRGGTGSLSRLPSMPDTLPDAGEAGTHNMPGIAGLSAGLSFVLEKGPDAILRHERALASALAGRLKRIRGVTVFAPEKGHPSGVLSFSLEGIPSEDAAARLAARGIAVRAGLHCSPLAHETAGTPGGTVRASFSAFSSMRDVYALADAVSAMV